MASWLFDAWRYPDGRFISDSLTLDVDLVDAVFLVASYVQEPTNDLLITVINAQGNPAELATVSVAAGPSPLPYLQVTDANGQTIFQGLSSGIYRFQASWSPGVGLPGQAGTIEVDPSVTASIVIQLRVVGGNSYWPLLLGVGAVGFGVMMFSTGEGSGPMKKRRK